jgi:hypothetical protein
MGQRMRLGCPLCAQRVCTLYHLRGRVACRHCNGLWYASQRKSGNGRKFLTMRKIRRKLGDYGQEVYAANPSLAVVERLPNRPLLSKTGA